MVRLAVTTAEQPPPTPLATHPHNSHHTSTSSSNNNSNANNNSTTVAAAFLQSVTTTLNTIPPPPHENGNHSNHSSQPSTPPLIIAGPQQMHQMQSNHQQQQQQHHENGNSQIYVPATYPNEFYPPEYFLQPDMHTPMCTLHSEYGPVTVPMVSQGGSPPIPMPVQVPPGHVMQQIVDENGTLRQVILSTAHNQPTIHQQGGIQQHATIHAPFLTANGTAPFYSPLPADFAGPATGQHFHPAMQTGGQHLQAQMSHSSPHSPSPPSTNHYKDERAQRQHTRLVRKLDKKNNSRNMSSTLSTPAHSPSPRKNELNGVHRQQRSNGTSSVGTSEDGEESSVPDEEDDQQAIIDQLATVQTPIITELTTRSALLKWTKPASTDNAPLDFSNLEYEILLSHTGIGGRYKRLIKGKSLSCCIKDLSPGREYACVLQVYYGETHCSSSEPLVFYTPKSEPNAPTDIKLTTRTKNSLQLKWNVPADNGAPILYYILECDNGKNGEFVEVCKTKCKQYCYNKLQPSTAYLFRLAAVNECGRSAYSPIVRFETSVNPPQQPMSPYLQHATSSSLRLGWNRRPTDDEYQLQLSDFQQGYFNVYVGPDNVYECVGLRRATNFQFRLRVKNEAGTSQWSDEVVYCTAPERPGRPNKPQVKGKIQATSFRVRWDPPHDRGGADIKLYYLEISSGAGFESVYVGPETEALCDRLSPGTTYQVRVMCEGPAGMSGSSDYCTITTEPVVPNAPPCPYLANQPGPYAAILRYDKPDYNGGAPVTSFEVEVEGSNNNKPRELAYSGKEQFCVVKDLRPGETYVVQVRAVNRIGPGEWSEEFRFKTAPAPAAAPSAPTICAKSPTQLSISWLEPYTNGAPITEYRLEYSQTEQHDGFCVAYQGAQKSTEVKNLTPFTYYYFRLCASNSAGTSPYSPVAKQQTPAAPPGIPAFDDWEKSACDIRLTWQAPECNGSPIVYYNIECSGMDRLISTSDAACEYLLENLSSETTYKIRIQAVNRVGTGLFSNYLKVTTLPLPPKPPKLECAQISYSFIKLKWAEEKPSASTTRLDIVRYYVEMQNNRTKEFVNVYTGNRDTCKVHKLHECQSYTFRIYAETDCAGMGDYSDEVTFTTPAALPNSIKAPRVVVVDGANKDEENSSAHSETSTSLTLEWQQSKNNVFNDRIEYLLQMSKGKNEQDYKEVYRGPNTRHTLTNLDYDTEYNFRVCPIRIMTATDDEVFGSFSPVLHHTIALQSLHSSDAVDSVSNRLHAVSNDHHVASAARLSCSSGSTETLSRENAAARLLYKITQVYKNRDKFTDHQKAIILVIFMILAALVCAAVVEMFLR
ncbi:fibronectin type-III domain-containing protein 3A isoform X2 [Culicoides brevitarsis]|uniref:fibronectin type-III domain-containing protein 3A isoform X2 n=1 Tax=Culicoides brevitarsis TaxID=469753 RepID=UPI00307CC250